MNIAKNTERRAFVLNSNGLWTFTALVYGPIFAAPGFRIVRQNQIAIFLREDRNGIS